MYLPWGNTYPKLKPSYLQNLPEEISRGSVSAADLVGRISTTPLTVTATHPISQQSPKAASLSPAVSAMLFILNSTQTQQYNTSSLPNSHEHVRALADYVGCPEEYGWCHDTPQMHIAQLVMGMLCLSIGYPLVLVLTTSIYSKIIGPHPQGLLQSWLAAVGGIARTLGPALVTYMYVLAGPRWTFLTVDGLLIAALLVLGVCYKRLIPYHVMVLKKNRKNFIVSESDIEKTYTMSRLQSCSSAETYLEDPSEYLTAV